jgi:hypothetical protein
MTEENHDNHDDHIDRAQAHLASIKRDMRKTLEDAAVRAMHKVMAEFEAKSDERLMEDWGPGPHEYHSLPAREPEQKPVALPEKIYEFVPTPEPEKWHHPECEGECIACLIERVVQEAYGSQGLSYLQRHLTPPPAQQEPLTDEQKIKAVLWDLAVNKGLISVHTEKLASGWSSDMTKVSWLEGHDKACDISNEAAHGIKGDA